MRNKATGEDSTKTKPVIELDQAEPMHLSEEIRKRVEDQGFDVSELGAGEGVSWQLIPKDVAVPGMVFDIDGPALICIFKQRRKKQ